jgi:hypothetical protein
MTDVHVKLGLYARQEAGGEDVGLGDQALEAGRSEGEDTANAIERLAPVDRLDEATKDGCRGGPIVVGSHVLGRPAHGVATRRLDLDDISTEIGENSGGRGYEDVARSLHDPDTSERLGREGSVSRHSSSTRMANSGQS